MSKIKSDKKENKICPVEYTVSILAGKYKIRILHSLSNTSPQRFKQLEKAISGISPTMLTTQLRELVRDGLVDRAPFATVPPTVEYSLSEFGKTTLPMLHEIRKWGLEHRGRKKR